jgi:hypothetical protein
MRRYSVPGRRGCKAETRLPGVPSVEHHDQRARFLVAPQNPSPAPCCGQSQGDESWRAALTGMTESAGQLRSPA